MTSSPSVSVISICSKSHGDVWRLTSELLPQFITADEFIVYVPEHEIKYFEDVTNSKIFIRSQEELGKNFHGLVEKAAMKAHNLNRFGWYLQQFYKIQALQLSTNDVVVIWDADCVPVKKIDFFNDREQIIYVNSSTEFHEPYFSNIKILLDLDRIQNICFVIPGFPIKNIWVKDFIRELELKHRTAWYQAIIDSTDFGQISGFSETETLGTWVANRYPNEWTSRLGTWERYGQSRFGYARNFTSEQLVSIGNETNLEIITFENWDLRGPKRYVNSLKKLKIRINELFA